MLLTPFPGTVDFEKWATDTKNSDTQGRRRAGHAALADPASTQRPKLYTAASDDVARGDPRRHAGRVGQLLQLAATSGRGRASVKSLQSRAGVRADLEAVSPDVREHRHRHRQRARAAVGARRRGCSGWRPSSCSRGSPMPGLQDAGPGPDSDGEREAAAGQLTSPGFNRIAQGRTHGPAVSETPRAPARPARTPPSPASASPPSALMWVAVIAQARFERREAVAAAIDRNSNLAVAFEEFTRPHHRRRRRRRQLRQAGVRAQPAPPSTSPGSSPIAPSTPRAFAAISIVDEQGRLVATSFERVPGGPLTAADRPHFTVHIPRDTGKVFVGQPILSRLDRQVPPSRSRAASTSPTARSAAWSRCRSSRCASREFFGDADGPPGAT